MSEHKSLAYSALLELMKDYAALLKFLRDGEMKVNRDRMHQLLTDAIKDIQYLKWLMELDYQVWWGTQSDNQETDPGFPVPVSDDEPF